MHVIKTKTDQGFASLKLGQPEIWTGNINPDWQSIGVLQFMTETTQS